MDEPVTRERIIQNGNRKVERKIDDVYFSNKYMKELGTIRHKCYIDDIWVFSIQDEDSDIENWSHCMIAWRRLVSKFLYDNRNVTVQDAIDIHQQDFGMHDDGYLIKSCSFVTEVEHQAEIQFECERGNDEIFYLKPTLIVNDIKISLNKEFAENICFTDMNLRFNYSNIKDYIEREQNFFQIELLAREKGKLFECQYREYRFYMTSQLYYAINSGRHHIKAGFLETGNLFNITSESKRRYVNIKLATGDYPVLVKVTKDNQMIFEPHKR